ncbi:hypothetical protein D3C81_1826860 [compost metagenome]
MIAPVHSRRFLQPCGKPQKKRAEDNHIVHADKPRDNHNPEGIHHAHAPDQKEAGNQPAAEVHGDDAEDHIIFPADELSFG